MDIKEINSAIMFGSFTNEQLTSIGDAVRYARAQLGKQQARALRSGDSVKFTSRGMTYFGIVDRVKIKNAVVKVGGMSRYNVPLNMLEAV